MDKRVSPTVWYGRFTELRSAGITFQQALVVYDVLDKARAFGTRTIAASANTALLRAYDRDEETITVVPGSYDSDDLDRIAAKNDR